MFFKIFLAITTNVVIATAQQTMSMSNCAEGQLDFWRLRRVCTDRAAYAISDTIILRAEDNVQNWNTFPWRVEGTAKIIIWGDTLPHITNFKILDEQQRTLYNLESVFPLVGGDWDTSRPFLGWLRVGRILTLVGWPAGNYILRAEYRATGYQGVSLNVNFRIDQVTTVADQTLSKFTLTQNYPNPFNPSTTIQFSVDKSTPLNLSVYNLLGQKVATLFDGQAEAGRYYQIIFRPAETMTNGVYIYTLQGGRHTISKKMILLR